MTEQRTRNPVTAGELAARLAVDPAYAEMRGTKDSELEARQLRYLNAARPVLDDLRLAGYEVSEIADLRTPPVRKYRDAVPILIRWLPRISEITVKEDIVRTLSVPWARAAIPLLFDEFAREPDDALRWVIGNALEGFASDELFDDFARIAADRSFGTARQMVVLGLGRMAYSRAVPLLLALLEDDDVAVSAMIALGKLRAKESRPLVERFLGHPDAWVRRKAKTALARIDR